MSPSSPRSVREYTPMSEILQRKDGCFLHRQQRAEGGSAQPSHAPSMKRFVLRWKRLVVNCSQSGALPRYATASLGKYCSASLVQRQAMQTKS